LTFGSSDVPKFFGPSTAFSNNPVSGVSGTITDVNVTLDLTHTWDGDVALSLISPTGTEVFLVNGTGGASNSGDNYTNTTFDDEAGTDITSGSPPYTGTFRPVGFLGN